MAKKTSKVIAMLFALLMVLTVAAPALAEGETQSEETKLTESTTGSIIMYDATDGDTFNAYQIMKLVYSEEDNSMEYTPSAAFGAFLTSKGMTWAQYQALGTDSTEIKTLLGGFSAYCKSPGAPLAFTLSSNTLKTGVELGQYVINGVSSTTDQNVFQVMTASFPVTVKPDPANNNKDTYYVNTKVTIEVKKDKPTVVKSVVGGDIQYAIGEYIPYEIITSVPTYPASAIRKTYVIGDTCDTTLTHIYDDTAHPIVVKGKLPEGTSFTKTFTLNTDYTITKSLAQQLEITFSDYDKIAPYAEIQVLYYDRLNQTAVVTDPMNNTATLKYSTDPYNHEGNDETIDDDEKVYSYGLEVTKLDAADATKPLPGAEFEVYKASDTEFANPFSFIKVGNDYKVVETAATAGAVSVLPTDAQGKINILGLDVGDYILKETKVPAGYTMPTNPNFPVTIADTEKDGTAAGSTANGTTGIVPASITNAKVTTVLPQTGGAGTVMFIIIGVAIMVAAVVVFAVIRKKAKEGK